MYYKEVVKKRKLWASKMAWVPAVEFRPQFHPQKPFKWQRRGWTPQSFLTSTCTLWHSCLYMSCIYTRTINDFLEKKLL